jgi:hypothetical protein
LPKTQFDAILHLPNKFCMEVYLAFSSFI